MKKGDAFNSLATKLMRHVSKCTFASPKSAVMKLRRNLAFHDIDFKLFLLGKGSVPNGVGRRKGFGKGSLMQLGCRHLRWSIRWDWECSNVFRLLQNEQIVLLCSIFVTLWEFMAPEANFSDRYLRIFHLQLHPPSRWEACNMNYFHYSSSCKEHSLTLCSSLLFSFFAFLFFFSP